MTSAKVIFVGDLPSARTRLTASRPVKIPTSRLSSVVVRYDQHSTDPVLSHVPGRLTNLNAEGTLMHSIPDKAEVGIDFPDKFYIGGFGRDSGFEAKTEEDGVLIRLIHSGEKKRTVEIHLHHFLLANILDDLAASLSAREPIDEIHREPLAKAAHRFAAALDRTAQSS